MPEVDGNNGEAAAANGDTAAAAATAANGTGSDNGSGAVVAVHKVDSLFPLQQVRPSPKKWVNTF